MLKKSFTSKFGQNPQMIRRWRETERYMDKEHSEIQKQHSTVETWKTKNNITLQKHLTGNSYKSKGVQLCESKETN